MRQLRLQAIGKVILFLGISLLFALPQAVRAADEISEALLTRGVEVVENTIPDYKAKKVDYLEQYEEEVAKIEALTEDITRLQRNRTQATEKLSATQRSTDK